MAVGLTALEFLVAFLQAYVFAMLTCIYLNDALHPATNTDQHPSDRRRSEMDAMRRN